MDDEEDDAEDDADGADHEVSDPQEGVLTPQPGGGGQNHPLSPVKGHHWVRWKKHGQI